VEAVAPPASAVLSRFSLEVSPATPVYYVNYAEVSFNSTEFGLAASRIPPKPPRSVIETIKDGVLTLPADVQLIIPVSIVPGLIKALETTAEQYEKHVGVPVKEVGVKE